MEHVPLRRFREQCRWRPPRGGPREWPRLIRLAPARSSAPVVLRLATGSTPIAFYSELVRLHREEKLSFANVVTFNLDEYYPLPPDHPQSYRHFMRTHLFDHVDIPAENINLPSMAARAQAEIGRALPDLMKRKSRPPAALISRFSALGAPAISASTNRAVRPHSRTRLVTLDPLTRAATRRAISAGRSTSPRYALSMGVRTILEARRVVLMAWGQHKAGIVRTAMEHEVTAQVTASFLQQHENALFVLDHAAAGALRLFDSARRG